MASIAIATNRSRQGFTLVELLVAVLVSSLGLMALIALIGSVPGLGPIVFSASFTLVFLLTFVAVLTGPEKLAIVERYIAAYNSRDTETILSLYARQAKMEDPIGLPPAVGAHGLEQVFQHFLQVEASADLLRQFQEEAVLGLRRERRGGRHHGAMAP